VRKVEEPDHDLLVGDPEIHCLALERVRSPKLFDLIGEKVVVGDLAVEHGPRRELAVPYVLKIITPGTPRDLYGFYSPTIYVETDRRRLEEGGSL
jgi:hypothetical protein